MSQLKQLAARALGWTARSFSISIAELDHWMDISSGFGPPTYSGVAVSEKSSIRNATVYACWKILSEDVASLPLPVYRRMARGKERAADHPNYRLLHDEANPEISAFNFRQVMIGNVVLWGNAYAEIERNTRDQIVSLWPLLPDRMTPQRLDNGMLVYRYLLPNGQPKTFRREQIWHIAGLGFNGLVGQSPIALARQGIGIALAGEELAGRMFGNNTHFGGFLQHPKNLSTEAKENLERINVDSHGGDGTGLSRAMRLKVLEEGMTYEAAKMPMRDAQWIDSRKFQKLEIAQFFRMQPHKVLSMETGVSYASIEQQNIDYVVGTLRPWLVMVEQSANMQLFRPEEQRTFFAEHVVEGLLRGHASERGQFYNQQFGVGALSPNEIRELENRNPIEGGDQRFVPLNMVPLNGAGQPDFPDDRSIELRKDGTVLVHPKADTKHGQEESRAVRSVRARVRTSRQFKRVFQDAASRIVRRETKDISQKARAAFGNRQETAPFLEWLDEYYEKAPEWIRGIMGPVAQAFAESIASEAADEVRLTEDIQEDLQRFADEYTQAFATRHVLSSEGQIASLTENAIAAGEDPLPLIEGRLAEWEESRPEKVSGRETVQAAAAVSKFVYASAGVTALRWVAQGSKSCPICQSLDGRVVGIQQNFVSEGEAQDPDGQQAPMKIRGPVSHPPIHEGCECALSPA